jgi:hypothetical protein
MRNHICAICGFLHVHNLHVVLVSVRYKAVLPLNIAVDFRLATAHVVYIASERLARVFKVTPAGTLTTIACNGSISSHQGDGGPALGASCQPKSIALDPAGNLYIAEAYAGVRKVSGETITKFAGGGFKNADGPANDARINPTAIVFDSAGTYTSVKCTVFERSRAG